MADPSAGGEVRAAGMVLWRPSRRGTEVALVHRPRYDDWSFPKGKLNPGEHRLLAAVREVAEETGLLAVLGRPLPTARYSKGGRPKRVDYWAGRPVSGGQEAFRANSEIDAMDWLPVPAAGDRLSYPHDAAILDGLTAGPAETVPLAFLRHASAGSKNGWPGDDLARPLDAVGVAQADLLARLLACFGSLRVISSPAERCLATVRPYAALTGAKLDIEPAFTAGPDAPDPAAAAALVPAIVTAGLPVVVCAHRENLPPMLAAACAALGAASPGDVSLGKGAFWVLHAAGGRLAASERHCPDGE